MPMLSHPATIGILLSNLDRIVFKPASSILCYDWMRRDRNRHVAGFACYSRNYIC